ncbi:MAG: hypothetical protein GX846_03010 [Deltaproteobacteria bacterium]|nr:hypothetical protein [Deltaproteobacteria bacterium]
MPKKIILVLTLLFLGSCGSPQDYSQTYVIVMNREKAGKEIVNEKVERNGNRTVIAEQELDSGPSAKDKKKRIIKTRMVLPKGALFPLSLSFESSTGVSYDITAADGKIIKTQNKQGEKQVTQESLETDMPVLNLAVFHTFDYWISKYDASKGGRQTFPTYLLPSGQVLKTTVTPMSSTMSDHDSKQLKLKRYEIELGDEIVILLWVDQDSRLYRLFIQGPNVEVIRSDVFSKIEKK